MLVQKLKELPPVSSVPNLIALDFETDEGMNAEGFSFAYDYSFGKLRSFYVPFNHSFDDDDVYKNLPSDKVLAYLRRLCSGRTLIFHNAQFDIQVLRKLRIIIPTKFIEDTMLMHYTLDTERGHGLKDIMRNEYGVKDAIKYDEARQAGFKRFAKYAEDDSIFTYKLYQDLRLQFEKHPKAYRCYKELEIPFVDVLRRMNYENSFIRIDRDLLRRYIQILRAELKLIHSLMVMYLGDINFNSSQQLAPALEAKGYDVEYNDPTPAMIARAKKKGVRPKGNPCLSEGAIENMDPSQGGVVLDAILYNRTMVKMDSTYFTKLYRMLVPKKHDNVDVWVLEGFEHIHIGTRHGRLSSANPNVQNMPRDVILMRMVFLRMLKKYGLYKTKAEFLSDDLLKKIDAFVKDNPDDKRSVMIKKLRSICSIDMRRIFIAMPGRILIDADYSQLELRMMAHLSNDKNMIAGFLSGKDFHQGTADEINRILGEDFADRFMGKTTNFAKQYGQWFKTFAHNYKIAVSKAKRLWDAYDNLYAQRTKFIEDMKRAARKSHFAQTILGRRRNMHTCGINDSSNFGARNWAENSTISTIVSGSSADLIKVAMINLHKKYPEIDIKFQVHDELLCEVPKERAKHFREIIEDEMKNAMKLRLPIEVEARIADNWRDAH